MFLCQLSTDVHILHCWRSDECWEYISGLTNLPGRRSFPKTNLWPRMASWEFAIPAQSIWLWSAEMGLRWSNALGIVNSKIIWVLLLNAWLVSPLFEIFLKWSTPRKVSTRLMVSMKVSPSMLGYWNFWKLSEFGRKSNLTSVFVGVYNVHVETTSGPDMCASFSRFYSFTGLIVHPSLHHPTYPPFQRYPAAEASWKLHKQVLYEEKGGKLTRMWIKFDPWIWRKTESLARLWSWWNHWFW